MPQQTFLFIGTGKITTPEDDARPARLSEHETADFIEGLMLPLPAEAVLLTLEAHELMRPPQPKQ